MDEMELSDNSLLTTKQQNLNSWATTGVIAWFLKTPVWFFSFSHRLWNQMGLGIMLTKTKLF